MSHRAPPTGLRRRLRPMRPRAIRRRHRHRLAIADPFALGGDSSLRLLSENGSTMFQPMAEPFRVALFVTCLVDLFRPSVGFAAVKLLEDAGCVVDVPEAQSCCGQPAYNSGDRADAKAIARQVIAAFSPYDYVVVPSGSCGGMIKTHYPALLADDPATAEEAKALAARTYELVSFLADVLKRDRIAARYAGTVTYHDACSGLRGLGVKEQPRRLLQSVAGLTLKEMATPEVCCGFGG